jgi:hypothetical protein
MNSDKQQPAFQSHDLTARAVGCAFIIGGMPYGLSSDTAIPT